MIGILIFGSLSSCDAALKVSQWSNGLTTKIRVLIAQSLTGP